MLMPHARDGVSLKDVHPLEKHEPEDQLAVVSALNKARTRLPKKLTESEIEARWQEHLRREEDGR